MNWTGKLTQFLQCSDKFRLVYGNVESLMTGMTQRLIILDSSFNPPHLGHFSMIQGAIMKPPMSNSISIGCINTNSVLLMLSIKNVDKPTVEVDQYSKRLEMIEKMAVKVREELGVECGICLVKCPLFTEKAIEINKVFNKGKIEFDYLLGFDTLIRLFDPKYYKHEGVSKSLDEFIKANYLTVFLRDDGITSVKDQNEYFEKLKTGQISGIPSNWINHINLRKMEDHWWISSSLIRRKISDGDETWRRLAIT